MIRRAFICTAVAAFAAPAYAVGDFFTAFDDVPLAPGFTETMTGFAFDSEAGRVVEAEAESALRSIPEQRAFYAETMPELGWSQTPNAEGPLLFRRGREQLTLTFAPTSTGLRLRARLVVRAAVTSD